MKTVEQGFTLVELMIVVAVLAVLAVIAYPSYQDYIRRSRMEEARAAMMDNIKVMERHYARYNTFCEQRNAGGGCSRFPVLPAGGTDYYDFSLVTQGNRSNADNFVLAALPKNGLYSDAQQRRLMLSLYYSSLNGGFLKCQKGADIGDERACEGI